MTNSAITGVINRTPAEMYSTTGGLFNLSDTDDAVTSGRRFARVHGLSCNPPRSWMLSALRSALQRGPLMFDMLWQADQYIQGNGSPGHMIVVVGIRGDGDQTGAGTTLRIHDPWPPGHGKKHSVGYKRWMNQVTTRTYRVFEK